MEKHARQFKENFREYYEKTYRFVVMRLAHESDAEDVTAEALTSAWKSVGIYAPERADMATWIIAIARHKIADHWRKRRDEVWDEAALEAVEDHRVAFVHDLDARLVCEKMFAQLPDEYRALLVLRHNDGLTSEEIATIVNKSPDAVRQALSRLHKKLAKTFPEYENLA